MPCLIMNNLLITQICDEFIELIKEDLPYNKKLYGIYLGGGFGKNEGSWELDNLLGYVPKNDLDFFIVFSNLSLVDKKKIFEKKNLYHKYLKKKFNIPFLDIGLFDLDSFIKNNKSIARYEMVLASKFLKGNDFLYKFKSNYLDIPHLADAFIQFANRMAGFNLELRLNKNKDLNYQIIKLAISVGDSILIFNNKYSPFYKKRSSLLKSIGDKNLSFLIDYYDFKIDYANHIDRIRDIGMLDFQKINNLFKYFILKNFTLESIYLLLNDYYGYSFKNLIKKILFLKLKRGHLLSHTRSEYYFDFYRHYLSDNLVGIDLWVDSWSQEVHP